MQIFVFVELVIKELCFKYYICELTYNQAYLYIYKYIYLRILNNYQNRSLVFYLIYLERLQMILTKVAFSLFL